MTDDQLDEIEARANGDFDHTTLRCPHGREPADRCDVCGGDDVRALLAEVVVLRSELSVLYASRVSWSFIDRELILKRDVEGMKARSKQDDEFVAGLQAAVDRLNGHLSIADSNVAGFGAEITRLNTEIATLKSDLEDETSRSGDFAKAIKKECEACAQLVDGFVGCRPFDAAYSLTSINETIKFIARAIRARGL